MIKNFLLGREVGSNLSCQSAVISAGETDCDTMATVIWEWFGEN